MNYREGERALELGIKRMPETGSVLAGPIKTWLPQRPLPLEALCTRLAKDYSVS
jgi:hypothetical protein